MFDGEEVSFMVVWYEIIYYMYGEEAGLSVVV